MVPASFVLITKFSASLHLCMHSMETAWYEENCRIICLIRMHSLPSTRACGLRQYSSSRILQMVTFSAFTWLVGQEEHPACKKLSDEVLEWITVRAGCSWFAIRSSWCHCHLIISCFIHIPNGLTFLVPAYPGCPEKEAAKWVSVQQNFNSTSI